MENANFALPPSGTHPLERVGPLTRRCRALRMFCQCFLLASGFSLVGLGIVVLLYGYDALLTYVLPRQLVIEEDNEMFESWLHPPVQPHLEVYAFNVTNPDQVSQLGAKPIVREVGPFVYRSVTVKNDGGGIDWDPIKGTMTYRPRKIYTYLPDRSIFPSEFSYNLTFPNLPLLTALNSVQGPIQRTVAEGLVTGTGRGTPFVETSLGGLLWGYEDELPCIKLDLPNSCRNHDGVDEGNPFARSLDDNEAQVFGDDDFFASDDFFGDEIVEETPAHLDIAESVVPKPVDEKKSMYEGLEKPKAEFVDCKCRWGLFRDRNVTLRESIQFFTGSRNPRTKGRLNSFNGSKTLGWWKEGSRCDFVTGQDAATFPPGVSGRQNVFLPVLCRDLPLVPNGQLYHGSVRTIRYEPPANAMGTHDDPNPLLRNEANECYCRRDEGYDCYGSGVLNLGPCKRETGMRPPLALSMPHFLGANESFGKDVVGLNPDRNKHQFYLDLVPELGIPLAMRARFQLNIILKRNNNLLKLKQDQVVLPLLWAQEGFDLPSAELLNKVRKGLGLTHLIVVSTGMILIIVGAAFVIIAYCICFCCRRTQDRKSEDFQMHPPPSSRATGYVHGGPTIYI